MKQSILTALLSLALLSTASAQQVHQVTVGDNLDYGLTYSLPTTALRLTLTSRCTATKAGPYALYAEKFLGLTDVALSDCQEWQIEALSMEAVAKADPQRTYHITFSEKGALPTFYLTDEQCLWGINQEPELPAAAPAKIEEPVATLSFRPTDVLTTDILKAGSKAKQAELIAQEILSIRESRSELIRGEADNVPNDGQQLQLMLDNLTAQEAALMTYFTGTTTVSHHTQQLLYVPTEAVTNHVLFRFSSQLGLVDADDLAGAPYYLNLTITEDNRLPEVIDPKAQKKVEKGIAFCIPGKAQFRVFDVRQTFLEGEMSMAQFGHVEQLPQAQFTDKKRPCAALLVPTTGALRSFTPSL